MFRCNSWASDVEPSNVLGHFCGKSSREGRYLFMDVHKKSVRGPATLFADGVMMDAVEVHCHGASCS